MMGYSDILIHIRDELGDEEIRELASALGQRDGVLSACISTSRRHLMLVQFDPEGIRPGELVREVRSRGLAAEMVGL